MKRTALTILSLIACSGLIPSSASAGVDGPGAAGAGYLILPVGPRAIAMGEARTAAIGDPFDWTVNPASLQTLGSNGVGAFHSEWIMQSRYDHVCGNWRANDWFSVGGGFTYQYDDEIQGYNAEGLETGMLENYSYQGMVGLGFTAAGSFSAGINLKFFRETLSEWSAGGLGVDIGARYEILPSRAAIGFAVQNIGPDVQFDDAKESLPMTVRGGAAWTFGLQPGD
ncbi:MAG: PorV/PorQ family protein, partial [Candidatus Krumholzibacteria bacterium]|nr:PorV/PorQ family protein [Candidatus Krumholzibacteria bacterium]